MSAPSLRLRGTLAVAATALLVTACGSSSSSGAAAGGSATSTGAAAATSAATGTGAAATTSAAAGASSAAAATSGAATTSAAPAPTTTKVVATGGGSFCKDIAKTLNDAGTTGTTDTVAAEKALVEKGLAELAVLTLEAPSEIKSDVKTLAGAVGVLYGAVQKANYDFTKVDTTALTALDTPAVKASETKVDAYVKVHCGIDVGAAASSS